MTEVIPRPEIGRLSSLSSLDASRTYVVGKTKKGELLTIMRERDREINRRRHRYQKRKKLRLKLAAAGAEADQQKIEAKIRKTYPTFTI